MTRPLPTPTDAHPGTPERVAVYASRYAADLALHHPADRKGDTGDPVPARLACDGPGRRAHGEGLVRFRPRRRRPPTRTGHGLALAVCAGCGVRKPIVGDGPHAGYCVRCRFWRIRG